MLFHSALGFLYLASVLSAVQALRLSMSLAGSALIVQNKSGGHGTVGYQLCKQLLQDNPQLQLTLLQDKCDYKKPPFSSYDELTGAGVSIVEADLSAAPTSLPESIVSSSFDYVVDNWSKGAENAAVVIDIAKRGPCKQLMFVSSAGMYKPFDGVAPHVETDAVKENGPRQVELAVVESGLPYTFMRPQYIYGPKISKRYLDYFVGRAVRKLPTPLPLHGEQLVCLTHIEDVAGLLAAALGHPAATNEIFNCGTDTYVTYRGISELFHDALGNSAEDRRYMYYEPKEFEHWKGGFPFRRDTFITSPGKAKQLLGWAPKHKFAADVAAEVADYKSTGAHEKEWGIEELSNDFEVERANAEKNKNELVE